MEIYYPIYSFLYLLFYIYYCYFVSIVYQQTYHDKHIKPKKKRRNCTGTNCDKRHLQQQQIQLRNSTEDTHTAPKEDEKPGYLDHGGNFVEMEEEHPHGSFEDDLIHENIHHSHAASGKTESPAPNISPYEVLTSEQTKGKCKNCFVCKSECFRKTTS